MSIKHPIIVITGSSGAGTSTVRGTFEEIFRREGVVPAIVEGDAFHRYDRDTMEEKMIEMQRQGYANFSHFGPEASLFEELEALFREYGERGSGRVRRYLHNEEEARPYGLKAGTFTPWEGLAAGTNVLFYEGLHGAVKTEKVNIARHADLLVGIVPSINLEWIQKLHRDKSARGQTHEAVVRPCCAGGHHLECHHVVGRNPLVELSRFDRRPCRRGNYKRRRRRHRVARHPENRGRYRVVTTPCFRFGTSSVVGRGLAFSTQHPLCC